MSPTTSTTLVVIGPARTAGSRPILLENNGRNIPVTMARIAISNMVIPTTMAIEKSALRVTELDYASIRENLKTFLRSQTEFQDFDFEGAGMAVLLDILAYNTHYMGYYLNMVANESFLDSAQLRNSIISHAKLMNYVPGSKQGALSRININVTPSNTEDANTNSLTLEKYTRLLGRDMDGVNYPFVTLYSNTVSKSGQSFNFSNVYVKQGEVVTLQYLVDPANIRRTFEIPSQNVDTTSVVITVQESSSNTDVKLYTQATDLTEVTANSMVYWLEENDTQTYSFALAPLDDAHDRRAVLLAPDPGERQPGLGAGRARIRGGGGGCAGRRRYN